MPYIDYVPEGAGIGAVYAFDRQVWDPFLEFTHHLMRGPSPLSFGQRELIAAYVARLSDCAYCAGAHGSAAAEFGYPAELQAALVADLDSAPLGDEKLRSLLRYVRELTLRPTGLGQADMDALRQAGWEPLAINHAIGIAARYVMATRISQAHGIVVEPEKLLASGKTMADPAWTCMPPDRRAARAAGD